MKSIIFFALVSLLLLAPSSHSSVAQGCVEPEYSYGHVSEGFGKLCCRSGMTFERGQEASPCLGNDLFACWARVKSLPPHYPECTAPSEELDCIPDYVLYNEWVAECFDDQEKCWYFEVVEMEVPAMRVILCGTENEEGPASDLFNEGIYDSWFWHPDDPDALPPISTNN